MRDWDVQVAEDEPVDFLIGMRWQELWRLAVNPWVPLAFARMLTAPEATDLRFSVRPGGPVVIQRWPSHAAVGAWARDRAEAHLGPWRRFKFEVGSTSDWGVWHELTVPSRAPRAGSLARA